MRVPGTLRSRSWGENEAPSNRPVPTKPREANSIRARRRGSKILRTRPFGVRRSARGARQSPPVHRRRRLAHRRAPPDLRGTTKAPLPRAGLGGGGSGPATGPPDQTRPGRADARALEERPALDRRPDGAPHPLAYGAGKHGPPRPATPGAPGRRSQASPANPPRHSHSPASRSHSPWFEHSKCRACAVLFAVA